MAQIAQLSPPERSRCDTGFSVKKSRYYVACPANDLLCHLRSSGRHHAASHKAAGNGEVASCAEECLAGNGASCLRTAQFFSQRPSAEGPFCAALFRSKSCQAGLPQACATSSPEETQTAERQAYLAIKERCEKEGKATWSCFYQAHSIEMLWGAGPGEPARQKLYQKVCRSPCPASPERCYRDIACQVLKDLN